MSDNDVFERLKSRLHNADAEFGLALSVRETIEFQNAYNVRIPKAQLSFLEKINGADCPIELLNFYCLNEFEKLTDSYNLNSEYLIEKDFDKGESPIWEIDNSLNSKRWLVEDIEGHYIFADYNIGGSFWSINLDDNSITYGQVLIFSFHCNHYRVCANSFDEYLGIYDKGEIEHLL
jgi:hypothetical protein